VQSQLNVASDEDQLYHDVIKGKMLCKKCIQFQPTVNYSHCPYARYTNKLEVAFLPEELKLEFMEKRAITLTHIYMSVILVRGRQAAVKGQVVHFNVDTAVVVNDLLPFP
jgi:hypothetical protein